ncbi:CxC2 domain-containing protein [Favolaschia claudopus]|uniref:CxC2 domain-containing protein n=1 Tax=Favolaschia claudopus TaxID=2862362 RepID=A0AAW0BMF1_9AGAR
MSSPFSSPEGRQRWRRGDNFVQYEQRNSDVSSDTNISYSQDRRRVFKNVVNVQSKKRRLLPVELEDPLRNWVPLREGDDILFDVDNGEGEGAAGEKRKRYESSDEPMKLWRPHMSLFLDELLRHEAAETASERCATCKTSFDSKARRFTCTHCGTFLTCLRCAEWNGRYWARVTLCTLGSVYQLGHGGFPCPHPASKVRQMVVMDFPSIHTIDYRYCACDASDDANNLQQLLRNRWYPATTIDPATCATFATLETYRLLNVVANVNVQDFIGTMERKSDATRIHSIPDRYKAFGLMCRQWACLKRLKRAGRAHDERGVAGTKNGECAVLCWACPHDTINLPNNWRDVSPEFQFLFILILAVDANFRMRHRLRANERDDPPLASGWGYMQEEGPYKEFLRTCVDEEDVSTCIAFQALLQKNTKMTTGLRSSGIGGVVCARHELVRPQGLGDLQKGERYSNMDYIVLAAVLGIAALILAISYDVVCQWKVKFLKRMETMPERLRLDMSTITVLFGLPVWHAAAHEEKCRVQNSLTFLDGMGRTDGEGIERFWSRLIAIAWASRVMGRGAREDAIEDKVDHENFEKNMAHGTTLPRKLVVAIDERDRQIEAFKQVDSTLEPELRTEWQAIIDAWKADPDETNPYETKEGTRAASETSIRRQLAQEELDEVKAGGGRLHGTSTSSFLVMGLQLENLQIRIRKELKGRALLVGDQTERVAQLRRSFFIKLSKFRRLQLVYMPSAAEQLEEDEEARDAELAPPEAEDIKIYMPSGLSAARRAACAGELVRKEARLREGQMGDLVVKLRRCLLSRRHLWEWREENVGQRAGTRAASLGARVQANLDEAARKYRCSREALIQLVGVDGCSEWKELRAQDVRVDDEQDNDAAARRKLSNVGRSSREAKRTRRLARAGHSREEMSWIWTSGGGPADDEGEELREAVRIEWSRAKARRDRWVEEVQHLREEMRRVLRFLSWKALWWEKRAAVDRPVGEDIKAGLRSYASRQAASARDISRRFKVIWDGSASSAVRAAMREDEVFGRNWEADTSAEGVEGAREVEVEEADVFS